MEKTFFLKNDPIKISILRTSLDGIPKAGKGTWRIASLKGPSETLLPAEQPLVHSQRIQEQRADIKLPAILERERWNHSYNPEAVLLQWEEGATQASGTITHGENGEGKITVLKLGAGRLSADL